MLMLNSGMFYAFFYFVVYLQCLYFKIFYVDMLE